MKMKTTMLFPLALVLLSGCAHQPAAPASPPAPSAAASADKGLQRFIGLRLADMLVDLPKPLLGQGERILDRAPWGLVAAATEDGAELILLDRRDAPPAGAAVFVLEAILDLPAGTTWETKAWDNCMLNGKPAPGVVAALQPYTGCSPLDAPAARAWRVDPEKKAFVSIDPSGVRCQRPKCDEEAQSGLGGVSATNPE